MVPILCTTIWMSKIDLSENANGNVSTTDEPNEISVTVLTTIKPKENIIKITEQKPLISSTETEHINDNFECKLSESNVTLRGLFRI